MRTRIHTLNKYMHTSIHTYIYTCITYINRIHAGHAHTHIHMCHYITTQHVTMHIDARMQANMCVRYTAYIEFIHACTLHAPMHAYVNTYMYYMHTPRHTCIDICAHTYKSNTTKRTNTHTQLLHTRTYMNTCIHYIHTSHTSHKLTYICMRICVNACMHRCEHIRIHIYITHMYMHCIHGCIHTRTDS